MDELSDRESSGDRALLDALFSDVGRKDPLVAVRAEPTLGCRYAIVNAVLRDRSTGAPSMPPSEGAMFRLLARFMARIDGDRHQHVRSLFARTFTRKLMGRYAQLISERANRLLDVIEPRAAMDLVSDYARPLPFRVIADVLGVPLDDQPRLARWMDTLGASFAGQRDPAMVQRGNEAADAMIELFDRLLDDRAAAPNDDLLTIIASDSTTARDDRLANCIFFLLAGHTTSTTLVAAGAALLCQRPDQLAALQHDPSLWAAATEELLRYISPITITGVSVAADLTTSDGSTFRAGDNRLLCFAAANRDPQMFADPDDFNVDRMPNPHLAFSVGAHYCVGAPLARLHSKIALRTLFHRMPQLRLTGEPVWLGSAPLRQVAEVNVTW